MGSLKILRNDANKYNILNEILIEKEVDPRDDTKNGFDLWLYTNYKNIIF